jgi:ribosomal silencing factor RsfS
MPTDIKEILQKVLAEIDTQEKNDLLLELKNKKLTAQELVDAIRELPEDEKQSVREAFIEAGIREKGQVGAAAKELDKEAQKEEEHDPDADPKDEIPKKKKTRPGRKSGRAYDWYVDDKGKVIVTDVATVYSGEDEPEEIEMWEGEEEEESEGEEE